jgi:ectonucleotide pyrophosphatase/phosphodiesterase family protein 5
MKIFLTGILLLALSFSADAQQKQCTILISFDGFRWDYLDRHLTPTIDSLWRQGVRASSLEPVYPSKTFPNHLAIVTGMYPEHHGIIQNDFWDRPAGRRYKISDTVEVRDSRWYRGEAIWETAKKNGKVSASYFWPGSEISQDDRHPDYFERYNQNRPYTERVNGVLRWLSLPVGKRPDIITLYFDATDTQGHRYGPDSPEVNAAIAQLDSMIALLIGGLDRLKQIDSTNIILVSDHGMTGIDVSRTIVIDEVLAGEKYTTQWNGPTMLLESRNGRDREIADILKKKLKHASVYLKNEVPEYFHFSKNEHITPVIISADLGWSLAPSAVSAKDSVAYGKGNHGYDSREKDMHGYFVASGPAFKKSAKVGTLKNIDIYPLICHLLNIAPNSAADGRLEQIKSVLR